MKLDRCEARTALLLVAGLAFSAQAGPAPDMDSDGTPDHVDMCKLSPVSPSPYGCDTDMDGYGNACDADFTNDGIVGGPDLGVASANFGTTGAPGFVVTDVNCDGVSGGVDLGLVSAQFGGPPGPSGLACAGTVPCP